MKFIAKHKFVLCVLIGIPVLLVGAWYLWGRSSGVNFWDWYDRFVNTANGILAIIALFGAYLGDKRRQSASAKPQEGDVDTQARVLQIQQQQLASQIRKEIDDRFSNAIAALGSGETSARTGALYSLYHLAIESEKYRSQVAEILCSHIRSKTGEDAYKKEHPTQPSNEIQTAINLLFKRTCELRGLYFLFSTDLPPADLSRAYLVGADISYSICRRAIFWKAKCQKTIFMCTYCEGTFFGSVHCQGANFLHAQCQGAEFSHAQCQGAYFQYAQFQGACFSDAHCQGVFLNDSNFKGAYASSEPVEGGLSDRINQDTKLGTMVVSGKINDDAIDAINHIMPFMSDNWREDMQTIMKNSNERQFSVSAAEARPDGMITGILEDTPEIRQIAKEIDD